MPHIRFIFFNIFYRVDCALFAIHLFSLESANCDCAKRAHISTKEINVIVGSCWVELELELSWSSEHYLHVSRTENCFTGLNVLLVCTSYKIKQFRLIWFVGCNLKQYFFFSFSFLSLFRSRSVALSLSHSSLHRHHFCLRSDFHSVL